MYVVERENCVTQRSRVLFFDTRDKLDLYLSRVLETAHVLKDKTIGNVRYVDFADETGLISLIARPADMPA